MADGVIRMAALAGSYLTKSFGCLGPNKSLCGRCSGKGFDSKHNGGQRKCQRCRGIGHTTVGRTKR